MLIHSIDILFPILVRYETGNGEYTGIAMIDIAKRKVFWMYGDTNGQGKELEDAIFESMAKKQVVAQSLPMDLVKEVINTKDKVGEHARSTKI
jgi:hypothetical protein